MRVSIKDYWNMLAAYLQPQLGMVVALAVLLFLNIGLQLGLPQILRSFLDAALNQVQLGVLTRLAAWFIGFALVQQVAAVGATYTGESVSWTATNWLRYDLAQHCLTLDMSFHNEHTPGEMIERIDGDVNALSNFFSQFTLQVLGNGVLLVGIVVLLFRENIRIGSAMLIFVLGSLVVINRLRNFAVPYWKESRESSADFYSFLEERFAGTEDIRSSGAKSYVMRRFFELMRVFWQRTVKARLMAFVMVNLTWFLFSIGTAWAFLIGASLYADGVVTLGTVYMIVYYTGMLSRPIERISQEIERLQEASAGIVRIQELQRVTSKLVPKSDDTREIMHLPGGPLAVEMREVTFDYEPAGNLETPNTPVISNLSFSLQPSRVLGVLGRTGSGKTTLTRLLFRMYDPHQGAVSIGDLDLRSVPIEELRQKVGVVTQNVQLFHASVRDNLTFFDCEVSDSRILQVIADLGLNPWYESLPDGLDTVLAPGGGDLSAGEAQLLAFTRVFLKDPGLVILDEASSRLDPATEKLIESAVDRLLKDRTGIIIAHRLGTVQRADEIMILEAGMIAEYGERAQLADRQDSIFSQLMQTDLREMLV